MRNLIATAAALLLLAACGNQNTNQQTKEEKTIPQREGITFGELQIGETNDYGEAMDATLTYTTTDGFTDTLTIDFPFEMDKDFMELMGVGEIEENDINFDGIKDLQVHVGNFNAAGNAMYDGFVWDKEKGYFVSVPAYMGIYDPEINEEDQTITGGLRQWEDGIEYFDFEKYQWVNGELVKVDEWTETFSLDDEE